MKYYTRKKLTYEYINSINHFGEETNYHYYIFSKGGFTDGLLQAQEHGKVQLLTLADIFE